MAEFTIKIDRTFLERIKNPMQRALDRAILRSLNRTITSVRTHVAREITDQTGIKRKDIMPRLFIHRAERGNRSAALKSLGRGVPLIMFGARTVKVKSGSGGFSRGHAKYRLGVTGLVKGQRQLIPGAFMATMRSGKEGVWERKGDARLPIRQLFSSDVQDMIRSQTGFLPKVTRYAEETFDKNFAADYSFYVQQEGLRTK